MPDERGYEIVEHTADVGVRAWGPDPATAFAEAAFGLSAVSLGEDPRRATLLSGPLEPREVVAQGEEWDELLLHFLAEFVYLFDAEGLLPRSLEVTGCAPPACRAAGGFAVLPPDAETAGVGVKAVTYHQLEVDVTPARTQLQVILDI